MYKAHAMVISTKLYAVGTLENIDVRIYGWLFTVSQKRAKCIMYPTMKAELCDEVIVIQCNAVFCCCSIVEAALPYCN